MAWRLQMPLQRVLRQALIRSHLSFAAGTNPTSTVTFKFAGTLPKKNPNLEFTIGDLDQTSAPCKRGSTAAAASEAIGSESATINLKVVGADKATIGEVGATPLTLEPAPANDAKSPGGRKSLHEFNAGEVGQLTFKYGGTLAAGADLVCDIASKITLSTKASETRLLTSGLISGIAVNGVAVDGAIATDNSAIDKFPLTFKAGAEPTSVVTFHFAGNAFTANPPFKFGIGELDEFACKRGSTTATETISFPETGIHLKITANNGDDISTVPAPASSCCGSADDCACSEQRWQIHCSD